MRSRATSYLSQPLDEIFARPANGRLLRELAAHGGLLPAPLLAARCGISRPTALAGLEDLVATGLVVRAGAGRAVLFGLDEGHYLVPALKALFQAENRREQDVLDRVRAAAERIPDLESLTLFGSAARGEDSSASDLDLLVVSRQAPEAWSEALSRELEPIQREHHLRIAPLMLSVANWAHAARANQALLWSIIREGRVLLGQEPAALLPAGDVPAEVGGDQAHRVAAARA